MFDFFSSSIVFHLDVPLEFFDERVEKEKVLFDVINSVTSGGGLRSLTSLKVCGIKLNSRSRFPPPLYAATASVFFF